MKVLSIIEPYATLIMKDKKRIETRSFKTNYRGELYIHASSTKKSKVWQTSMEVFDFVDDIKLNYGHIICKCNLVDCVCMTEEYIENLKRENYREYLCGRYEVGRYAWILEDIEQIEPIGAKGKLGIWNY